MTTSRRPAPRRDTGARAAEGQGACHELEPPASSRLGTLETWGHRQWVPRNAVYSFSRLDMVGERAPCAHGQRWPTAGRPPTSCREEKSLLMVLYSSTDPMYINRCLPGPRPPTKFTREGRTPRPGPGKGPGAPDPALNKNSSVLPSGVTLGPRVPSRICADRRTRARGSGVAEMTSCPGSARTSLRGAGPQLVRLLRGPGVAASRGPHAAGSGLASAAFFVE